MRFIAIVHGDDKYERGQMPTEKELADMGKYNEELVKAGIMLGGEGLHPTSKAVRIDYSGSRKPAVVDGPFAESKELVAGFWILQTKTKEEAVEWLKRAPFQEGSVTLRQIFEEDDFGAEFTPELREQERRIGEQAKANAARK